MYTHTIDYKMLEDSDLDIYECAVIQVLLRHSKNFRCSMQQKIIAAKAKASLSKVKQVLTSLCKKGWLETVGKNKFYQSIIYSINQKAYKEKGHIKAVGSRGQPQHGGGVATTELHNIYTYKNLTHAQRAREDVEFQEEPEKEKVTNLNEAREMKRKFPMTDDFELDETFELQCKMGGIDYKTLSESFLEEAMAEFKDYWVDEVGREHTRRQWQSKFIMNIKRNPPQRSHSKTNAASGYQPKQKYPDSGLSFERKLEIDEEMKQLAEEMKKERYGSFSAPSGLQLVG